MANTIGSSIVNNLTGGGIDIQSLAQQLTDATRAPQQKLIDDRKALANAKVSSIGKIYSAVNSMQAALGTFGDAKQLAYLPQTSDNGIASFTYSSYATQSSINLSLSVERLATVNSVSLAPLKAGDQLAVKANKPVLNICAGDASLVANGAKKVLASFDLSETKYSSLDDLRDAIKKVTGFDATIFNGTDGQTLTITHGTGEKNKFYVETLNADSTTVTNGLQTNSTIPNSFQSMGENAEIRIDNRSYYSESNNFRGLIDGVNVLVKSKGQASLSSDLNTSVQVSALRSLVSNYNSLLQTINDEIVYDADITKRGGLNNDPTTRAFLAQMRRLTTDPIKKSGKEVTLAEVGVRTNQDGTLSFDETRFANVQVNNPALLADVMSSTATESGALERFNNLTKTVLGYNSPFVKLYNKTNQKDLVDIQNQTDKLNSDMAALQQQYLQQFIAMQDFLASTKNSQTSLTQAMASWTAGLKG